MDEFPEFPRNVLDSLRQPIETGEILVSRAHANLRYPCRFLLVAAANPCRCGHLADPERACSRAPDCGADYLGRISGPMIDRFDLRIEVPPVAIRDLSRAPAGEDTATVAARVAAARTRQTERFADHPDLRSNADAGGAALEEIAPLDAECRTLIDRAADRFRLSARGYHRILRVARTIADLAGSDSIARPHLAEALGYRLLSGKAD